jgi:hypothetical protein
MGYTLWKAMLSARAPFDQVEDLAERLFRLAGTEESMGEVVASLVIVDVRLELSAPLAHLGLQILHVATQLGAQLHSRDGLPHRWVVQLGLVFVLLVVYTHTHSNLRVNWCYQHEAAGKTEP